MKKIAPKAGLLLLAIVVLWAISPLRVDAACSAHATAKCISNILYWYDSCGALEEIYKNCNTSGQICKGSQCVDKPQTGTPAPAPQTPTSVNQNQSVKQPENAVSIFLFANKQGQPLQWQKNLAVTNTDTIEFFMIVKNISSVSIDNIVATIDSIDTIVSIGNIKINGTSADQNTVPLVNLGTMAPKNSHIISFTALVLPENVQNMLQIAVRVNSGEVVYDSDYITLNITPETAQAPPTSMSEQIETTPTNPAQQNSFMASLQKSWYIWVMVAALLIGIFIVIFRKLSSNI